MKVKTSRGEQLMRWHWEEAIASAMGFMPRIYAMRKQKLCNAPMRKETGKSSARKFAVSRPLEPVSTSRGRRPQTDVRSGRNQAPKCRRQRGPHHHDHCRSEAAHRRRPIPALDGWLPGPAPGSPSINPLTGSVSQAAAAAAAPSR